MPTVRRTRHDFEELERLLFTELPKESAAFALAGAATHRGGTDVIVRRPVAIPDAHFSIQGEYHLRIATAALNGLFDRQVRAFGREGQAPKLYPYNCTAKRRRCVNFVEASAPMRPRT